MTIGADLSTVIREAILGAATDLIAGSPEFGAYEHGSCVLDLVRLSRGGDCYYDRPMIGLHYALWYHAQRTRRLVEVLEPVVLSRGERNRPLHIIDLGAGTGATATAIRIAVARLQAQDKSVPPEIRIVCLESSPFMLDALEAIDGHVAALTDTAQVSTEPTLCSWFSPRADVSPHQLSAPHLVASYSFDYSDRELNRTLTSRLRSLGDDSGAESLHLLGPRSKAAILDAVLRGLGEQASDSSAWACAGQPLQRRFQPTASLDGLGNLRRQLAGDHPPAVPWLTKSPSWSYGAEWCQRLDRAPTELLAPKRTFFGFALDEDQELAASPVDPGTARPTAIVGAAGSGKSYVLVERAARIVETDADSRVLISAFNVPMVDELARILSHRAPSLDLVGKPDGGFWWDRSESQTPQSSRLVLCNRDKLPTRIFDMRFTGHVTSLPQDIVAEAERFIWGKALFDRDAYLQFRRAGAGIALQPTQRERIWDDFWADGNDTFTHRRIETLKEARNRGKWRGQFFSHVLVDECQDFTEADFELLRYLVPDAPGVVAAGDEAQSLHLGGTYRRPTLRRADGSRTIWRTHRLEGAYRLPVATCRAVAPLAEYIRDWVVSKDAAGEDFTVPEPRKAATYGPRPIVLHADDVETELPNVLHNYGRCSGSRSVCVTDGPSSLRNRVINTLRDAQLEVESENMRKIKGLERPNVVILADAPNHDADTAVQCVYTAMTRSTSLAVLVLPTVPSSQLREALKRLRAEDFLLWNAQSVSAASVAMS